MRAVALMDSKTRRELFLSTASARNIAPGVIEKDFWVCYVLSELFSSELLKGKLMFKGGTSLSKAFGLIERFSEDIDIVLDWNAFMDKDPYIERTNTKQREFIIEMEERATKYIREEIFPELLQSIGKICTIQLVGEKYEIIDILYPKAFESEYLFPRIKLEIDAKGSWMPNTECTITSYAADCFPAVFSSSTCQVWVIDPERTFWEKAAILHKAAHRPKDKDDDIELSRHYYDLFKLGNSTIKAKAFKESYLLRDVIGFSQMFYPCSWARYDLAIPPTFRLIPEGHMKQFLSEDYDRMEEMFFGAVPSFPEILLYLAELENEINALEIPF